MNELILHKLTLFLLIFFIFSSISQSLSPFFQACEPRNCGNLTISYPFYIDALQEPYCGFPGFKLSCQNNQPLLNLSNDNYIIQSIFYDNQSFVVSNSGFLNFPYDCSFRVHNLTLDPDKFNFALKYGKLFLFQGCPHEILRENVKFEVKCRGENANNKSLMVNGEEPDVKKIEGKCREVVSVVYDGGFSANTDFGVVKRGIMINWTANSCNNCRNSGGRCGFNQSSSQFWCFCPDRPHASHCSRLEGTEKAMGQESRKFKLIGLGVGSLGFIIVIFAGVCLCLFVRRRREIRKKATYFKRNGGLLLQQEMNSNDGILEKTQIFTTDALERATDNFNHDLILGQGGQGTVFKGMLADGRIVAIKRSKMVEEIQLKEFINEIVILSQINHRNIVKLIGCGLEAEVPLLVYEFIPNGTLSHHLHNPEEEFHITWRIRLQIATDVANALAYLHSSSSRPIYHRDIKSSNILLDEQYQAKPSDFGISRSITMGQTHLTTRPIGTFGYLDPEFLESQMFTEKSDVYSFGVVLVELLTGQKAIRLVETEHERSLKIWFLAHTEESCLFDVVDSQIQKESKQEEFLAVANLAKRCLSLNRVQRPTMKQVVTEIEAIKSLNESVMLEKEIEL